MRYDPTLERDLLYALQLAPEGLTTRQLADELSRNYYTIRRHLTPLVAEGRIMVRPQRPRCGVLYCIPLHRRSADEKMLTR